MVPCLFVVIYAYSWFMILLHSSKLAMAWRGRNTARGCNSCRGEAKEEGEGAPNFRHELFLGTRLGCWVTPAASVVWFNLVYTMFYLYCITYIYNIYIYRVFQDFYQDIQYIPWFGFSWPGVKSQGNWVTATAWGGKSQISHESHFIAILIHQFQSFKGWGVRLGTEPVLVLVLSFCAKLQQENTLAESEQSNPSKCSYNYHKP